MSKKQILSVNAHDCYCMYNATSFTIMSINTQQYTMTITIMSVENEFYIQYTMLATCFLLIFYHSLLEYKTRTVVSMLMMVIVCKHIVYCIQCQCS